MIFETFAKNEITVTLLTDYSLQSQKQAVKIISKKLIALRDKFQSINSLILHTHPGSIENESNFSVETVLE